MFAGTSTVPKEDLKGFIVIGLLGIVLATLFFTRVLLDISKILKLKNDELSAQQKVAEEGRKAEETQQNPKAEWFEKADEEERQRAIERYEKLKKENETRKELETGQVQRQKADEEERQRAIERDENLKKENEARKKLEAEQAKKIFEERARKQKIEQDTATCKELLEQCGMQFFIRYYPQLKRLPISNITVSDHYFPERQVRLTAAKKIVDSGLEECALNYIIQTYGDVFSSEVIEQAKSILEEIKNEKGEIKMKTIKTGEMIYAKTNAELLNMLLGKHFKAFMKAYRFLDTGEMIWMPRLDGKVRSGWKNTLQNRQIIEEYVGGRPYPSEIGIGLKGQIRIVFEKFDQENYFIFRGVFEIGSDSTLTRRILRPIKDEISLWPSFEYI